MSSVDDSTVLHEEGIDDSMEESENACKEIKTR
jgi:hypothetical protein